MRSRSLRQNLTMLAGAGIVALAVATFVQSRPVHASPPPPPAHLNPMRLTVAALPDYRIGLPPSPVISANVDITLTSSGGPFCLQGLTIKPYTRLGSGNVWIALQSIDGDGMSHPYLTLFDGATGGSSPQDVVLSYGNAICASESIQFQARNFAGSSGPGGDVLLQGTAVYLSASDVIVTAR